jgi:Protein of unknown function (DUF3006)
MTRKIEEKPTTVIAAFIDRIEDEQAVIIFSAAPEICFNLPLQYLPPHAKAGDHLQLSFALAADSTAAARNRVAALQAELAQTSETETNIQL